MKHVLDCKHGIIGLAIGDALGVPVEFLDREYLNENPVSDYTEDFANSLPKGTWSDDTSMTIATMDSINKKKSIDKYDIMQNFIKWLEEDKYTATGECFDIGNTVFNAIKGYKETNQFPSSENEYSNGNGSLMRILPIAYYINQSEINDNEQILTIVKDVSSITHPHEISVLACYIYVQFANKLLEGYTKEQVYQYIQQLDYKQFNPKTTNEFKRILKSNISNLPENEIKSSGYVLDTLEASLWIFMNSINYDDAILKAVNLGDDTDTVGAVAGGLLGINYGLDSINKDWVNKIQNKPLLDEICNRFNSLLNELNKSGKDYRSNLQQKYIEISKDIIASISKNKIIDDDVER